MKPSMTSNDRNSPAAPFWVLMGIHPLRATVEHAGMQLMDRQALPGWNASIHAVIADGLGQREGRCLSSAAASAARS